MTTEISFKLTNEHNPNLDLVIEPFGIVLDFNLNDEYVLHFASTKKHDISRDVTVNIKNQIIEVNIEGGWIKFELYQEGNLLFTNVC